VGKKEKTLTKVVLDTNILVSALLFHGELSGIIELWKKGAIIPIFSRETFAEFKAVLEYPKFALKRQEINMIIEEEVMPYFEIVEVRDKTETICRDTADDKFIACALSASAEFIVTGDNDLLDVKKYKTVRIINAATLLKMFGLR
jgi:uncharacterized protein